MADLYEYKCPNCGGAVEFDTESQKVKCPFCDSEFDVDSLKSAEQATAIINNEDELDGWNTELNGAFTEGEAQGINTYICNSCGGEIIGDSTTGATSCPYCGNPVVVSGKFAGELKPDYVIPFKLDKEAAKKALSEHLMGKKLLPKVFKSQNHIDEIKGIYVPFWLFDAKVDGSVSYKATTVRHWSDKDYDYTQTSFYDLFRAGGVEFENIPVDASSKMNDDIMDSLEPFDFSEAVDFNTAYFAGYLADKYDVTVDENLSRINTRVKGTTEEVFKSTITAYYDTITTEGSYVQLKEGNAKYALLPVWMLNTTWNGEKYTFAMNGQTGKFVGNLPMDKGLYRKYFALAFGISTVVGLGIGYIANFFAG